MTLDEAIKHAEKVAEDHEKIKCIKAVTLEECKCAEEHRQLAEWLKELKQLREQKPKSEWQQDHEILKAYSDGANAVLDKIRAEIEEMPKTYPFVNHLNTYVKDDDVIKIIDKYKEEESEE